MAEQQTSQALVDQLAGQRNMAMNNWAQAAASLVVVQAECQRLTDERDKLAARVAELEPKDPPTQGAANAELPAPA